MKKQAVLILLFLVGNFLLFLLHLWLFKSSMPVLGWSTGLIHIISLILFPYTLIFKTK